MSLKEDHDEGKTFKLRLFLEELVCNTCRFLHVADEGVTPESVRVRQEVNLGKSNAFADILIQTPGHPSYIVEVDYGYSPENIIESIERKYSNRLSLPEPIPKLVLVVDRHNHEDWHACEKRVREILPDTMDLEVWDEPHLLALLREHFNIQVDSLSTELIRDLRFAIERAKGSYAFGSHYKNDSLDASLLWQFGYWRLKDLFESNHQDKQYILNPKTYQGVVVLYADLCGFSGYVRDTRNSKTIEDCLSAFCAKSRYQIINEGGMLYQFLGDAVIGLFGIPTSTDDYVNRSFDCARSLLMLADSVSNKWQRELDRLQPVRGCHIGMAIGDLQIVSFRPFSRTYKGAVGDTINMAARLNTKAKPGQIVISNMVYRSLSRAIQRLFHETEPVEAKNVGRIVAWTFDQEAFQVNSAGL